MAEDDRYAQEGIYSGISLFGPYGEGHAAFVPHNEVYAGEIHTLGWGAIEIEEGVYDWSLIDDYLRFYENEGKRAAIRIQSAGHSTVETPRWLYENYGVRQITGQGVFFDFSANEPDEQRSIRYFSSGRSEYLTTLTGGAKENGILVCNTPETVIESTNHLNGYETQIGFDYRGSGTISIVIERGGQETVFRTFEATEEWSSEMFRIPQSAFNYESIIKFVVDEPIVELNNVSISANAEGIHNHDRNLSFPNFFDPIYIEKYTNFVRVFAERYRDNPHVGAVVVGGFGKWDELSMLGMEQSEVILQTKQWRAYGFYDNMFIEHVDHMCQLFKEEFGDYKEIILHIAAFSLPATGLGDGAGDANYVGYAVNNLAKKYGFIAKLNGLTEKMSEWGQAQNGFNYFANRYKYDSDARHILETALQLNNPQAYWTGHPISLYNRVMIDQVDNLWHYTHDLKIPFLMKHAHTFNEQAGNALFTRSYNILKRTFFKADMTNWDGSTDDRVLRNIWNGLYLMNERSPQVEAGNDEHKANYYHIGGKEVLRTSDNFPVMRFSLDDRQSYNVMYGSVFAVEYFDQGTDTFTVILGGEGKTKELETVTKTDTNEFKVAYFHVGDFFDTKNNGDKVDVLYEVSIDDNNDGHEFINSIELISVPSIDWKEVSVGGNWDQKDDTFERISRGDDPIVFEVEKQGPVSSIDVNIGTDLKDYVLLTARVYAVKDGENIFITEKEHFMPGIDDILRLPVAKADYFADSFLIEVSALRGEGYVYTDSQGNYIHNVKEYDVSEGPEVTLSTQSQRVSALMPFYAVNVDSSGDSDITIQQNLGEDWVDVVNLSVPAGSQKVTFEPQIAGQYRIIHRGDEQAKIQVEYLQRRRSANPPTRYNLGRETNQEFADAHKANRFLWQASEGFSDIDFRNNVWSGKISSPNAYLETTADLDITPDTSQILHFIMKNETSSDMVKVYWMNEGDEEYTEDKVAYVPVVPHDEEFREYSWPIGHEASRYNYMGSFGAVSNRSRFTYADETLGKVTGFKIVPASGHTVMAGQVSIASISLRDDSFIEYSFREPLEIDDILSNETLFAIRADTGTSPMRNILIGAAVAAALIIAGGIVFIASAKKKKTGN